MMNSSNPEERAYFMEVCRYWIREFKVDGWRLDVANEVDRGFWRDFRRVAHEENPESVMIGEIWESSETWLNGDMFDSTMNYDFRKNCRDFFSRLIAIRKEHEELTYGDYTLRYMDHDGGYIYQRTWGDHKITVCLNNGSTTIDLREYLGKGSVLLSESYEAGKLGSMGYAIIEEK